jgi:hypothetical protein
MRVRMTSTDPSPVLADLAPPLHNEPIVLHGRAWTIEVVSVWPSGPGPHPDFDILCHLQPAGGGVAHSILFEVDRAFMHQKDAKTVTVRAIERRLLEIGLGTFARIRCHPAGGDLR